jgi:hypothetical protein
MESEEILDLQFTGSWSTCFPIPGSDFLSANPWKRFPISQSLEAISYQLAFLGFFYRLVSQTGNMRGGDFDEMNIFLSN